MLTLFSFIRDGKTAWQALTSYGATIPYETETEARLAGLRLIEEAQ